MSDKFPFLTGEKRGWVRAGLLKERIRALEAELAIATGAHHHAATERDALKRIIETAPTPGSLVAENERLKAKPDWIPLIRAAADPAACPDCGQRHAPWRWHPENELERRLLEGECGG